MKYDIILLDADDTLFDYGLAESRALENAFLQFGLPAGAQEYGESYKTINSALWRDLEQGIITSAALRVERFQRLFTEHRLELDPAAFSEAYLRHLGAGTYLIQGAEELCRELEGCTLAVITNGITEVQRSRIQGSPLHSTFRQVIISELAGSQKPEPGIFDYAFRELGLTAADKPRTLMVGDSLTSDIKGGNGYGIDTCWFNPLGKPGRSDIAPTYEIRELAELPPIIRGERA
ncbi:noncanonical pyrimidine nucleotidase, YjjG family [Paenibacillus spiritus]|uniref:Noncanonical pyrimidine nucleotidase, YjjG family n=1 Tax=Paenibacillus spiritus TaxID=2496557 RepID=A0A5J5G9J5_9BACL|nr:MULTISPECIES: YjjG family noncanonical pyrimidine nucleotidase [Paenibacillus]KAA9004698.1 noncanonical pyrimidine nucleotidase, YjjG family [Paenibacillus spiritus]